MKECPQGRAVKGSQKWLQAMVDVCPQTLDAAIQRESNEISAPIRWVSPLADDDFAEYYGDAFLNRLGVRLDDFPLDKFWPSRGPQWDALGRTDDGQIILLEAKAHVGEMDSHCQAKSAKSRALIRRSLDRVKSHVGADSDADWMEKFYQHGNRLAHLYLLRTLNKVPAYLVNLYFLNADDMDCGGRVVPKTASGWEDAIAQQDSALGIPPQHALSQYAIHAFVDVNDIKRALKTSSEWSSE